MCFSRRKKTHQILLDALFRITQPDKCGWHSLAGFLEVTAVGALLAPADASAQLIELRQAELLGVVDEHGVGGGDVHS